MNAAFLWPECFACCAFPGRYGKRLHLSSNGSDCSIVFRQKGFRGNAVGAFAAYYMYKALPAKMIPVIMIGIPIE